MANITVSAAIDNLLKSTPSTTVTTVAALKVLGATTAGDASIIAADLAPNAVTADKILAGAVTATKITDAELTIAKTNGLQSALDNKVDDSQLSTTGGANKIPQLDASGNWTTGPYDNDETTFGQPGNIYIPDKQGIVWMTQTGTSSGQGIYGWDNHGGPPGTPELIIQSPTRIAIIPNGGMQFGANDTARYPRYIQMVSGYATSTAALNFMPSGALMFQTRAWNGLSAVSNTVSLQAHALDTTGENSILRIYDESDINIAGGTLTAGRGDITGNIIAEIYKDGIYSAGTAPSFAILTPGATITQACSKYKTVQAAKVTLNQATTLAITGAEAGMRGVIYVKQDATGSRTLTLPAGSSFASGFALSTTPFIIDRLTWEFDGTYYFWTITAGIVQAIDTDAAAFIATTGATDSTALSEFVLGLKGMGLWATSVCWPMRSAQNYGSGTSLKSLGGLGTFDGTISGSPTWGAAGIAFDGVNDYISFATPGKSATLAEFTMFSVFDSDQTINRFVLGGFQSSATGIAPTIWAGGSPTGGSTAANTFYTLSLDGTPGNTTQAQITSGNTGVMQTSAMTANASEILAWANTTVAAAAPVRATYWNNNTNWHIGVRNIAGTFNSYFVGDQAFNFFSTTKLTSAQHTTLRTLYKTTLGIGLSLP
jgi:hypothetical protein